MKHEDGGAPSNDQAKDTGMALVLLLILVHYATGDRQYLGLATAMLVVDMAWPAIFRWPAKAWFGLAALMSTVASKILLSVVFFLVVLPIGKVLSLTGADPMLVRKWKGGPDSVFKTRDHTFVSRDLDRPF